MATTEQISQEQELKERLIRGIEQVHDLTALQGLSLLVDSLTPKKVYVLSPEEKKIVEERYREMENGIGIPHEEVCKKAEQWFLQKSR